MRGQLWAVAGCTGLADVVICGNLLGTDADDNGVAQKVAR